MRVNPGWMLRFLLVVLLGLAVLQTRGAEGERPEFKPVAHLGCTEIPLQCEPPSGSFFPEGQTQVIARPLNPAARRGKEIAQS